MKKLSFLYICLICLFFFNHSGSFCLAEESTSKEIIQDANSSKTLLEKIDENFTIFSKKMFAIQVGYVYSSFTNNAYSNITGNGFYIGITEKIIIYQL